MALADALAPIYAALAEPLGAAARRVADAERPVGHARRERPAARGERTPAPLAVGRAGARCREPAAEGQPALDPRPGALLRHRPRRRRCRRRLCPRRAAVGRAEPRHPQGRDRARRTRPGRARHRGRRAHRAGAADHRHEQPHPGDPGEHAGRAPSWSAPTGRGRGCCTGRKAATPQEGERVVTSAEAGAFPADLPVGIVRYRAANVPEVEPAAMLDRLEVVRIFDYGLGGIPPPEALGARCRSARRPLMARA